MDAQDFPQCPVCGTEAWRSVYGGPVRDGAFGKTRSADVARCSGCGVDRLSESQCLGDAEYAGGYRDHMGQGHDLARHYASHDEMAKFTTDLLWPESLRGKIAADIGCGGGSLLDHISGVVGDTIAIDPDQSFANSLLRRGYRWYPSAQDCASEWRQKVDVAFAIQVIEHVSEPRRFLEDCRDLLAPGGKLVVSTPNRRDILLELLPDDFPPFFYRTQHRWYFDELSLRRTAQAAGFKVDDIRHVHRYGMANTLLWLRDRRPPGRAALSAVDRNADNMWRNWLEASGRADNLYAVLGVA